MLQEETDREFYESYTAQCLWTIAQGLHGLVGLEFEMPQYIELIHPEVKKPQQTAQEIKDHMLERLLEG